MLQKNCLILFVKNPEKGKVKSRLSAGLDAGLVLNLYKHFVKDLLEACSNRRYTLIIAYYPPESSDKIFAWLGEKYVYTPQEGSDLGERMKNAFVHAFSQGFTQAAIIGSDSPDLPASIMDEAFDSLKTSDTVIGPTLDGGYYLIGFKKTMFAPEIFQGITWSTETVFKETMERLSKKGLSTHVLPTWRDVDTKEDLKDLLHRNKNTPFAKSKTMAYLLEHREII